MSIKSHKKKKKLFKINISITFKLYRYDKKEATSVNEDNKAIVDTYTNANGPGVFDGFDSQDTFSSKKAQEAFSTSTPDPFGNTFPSQSATVIFLIKLH